MIQQQHSTSTVSPSILALPVSGDSAPLQLPPPPPVHLYGQRVKIEGLPGFWYLKTTRRGFLELINWRDYQEYKDRCWNVWELPIVRVLPNRTVEHAPVPPRVTAWYTRQKPAQPTPFAPVPGAATWAVFVSALAVYQVLDKHLVECQVCAAFNQSQPAIPAGFTQSDVIWFRNKKAAARAQYEAKRGGPDEFENPFTGVAYAEV